MASLKSVEQQLKRIHCNAHGWGRSEIKELPTILLDDENIFECVNGVYEGGFALLIATDIRVLLIDRKPFKYLTVEDLRFDMINQIDYSHRIFGARINISAGGKNLRFKSYNQPRLRKLINHVQSRMANVKKEQSSSAETQQQHLERINEQLQSYLLAQHQHQEELHQQLLQQGNREADRDSERAAERANDKRHLDPVEELIRSVRPSPELADYLYAQSLMKEYEARNGKIAPILAIEQQQPASPVLHDSDKVSDESNQQSIVSQGSRDLQEMYAAGLKEVFGKRKLLTKTMLNPLATMQNIGFEVNPLRVACAKLPLLLRNRKFGLPSIELPSYTPRISTRNQQLNS
jgi:hypothetical protein